MPGIRPMQLILVYISYTNADNSQVWSKFAAPEGIQINKNPFIWVLNNVIINFYLFVWQRLSWPVVNSSLPFLNDLHCRRVYSDSSNAGFTDPIFEDLKRFTLMLYTHHGELNSSRKFICTINCNKACSWWKILCWNYFENQNSWKSNKTIIFDRRYTLIISNNN